MQHARLASLPTPPAKAWRLPGLSGVRRAINSRYLSTTRHAAAAEPAAEARVEQVAPQSSAQPGGTSVAQPQQNVPPATVPGDIERQKFQLHWSVSYWEQARPRAWFDELNSTGLSGSERLGSFFRTINTAVSESSVLSSSEAAQYWAYHLARLGFFTMQGFTALAVSQAVLGEPRNLIQGVPILGRLEDALKVVPGPLSEALMMFRQDFQNILEGRYKLPWDMTTLSHRQFNPAYVLRRSLTFLREATDILGRRNKGTPEEVWMRSNLLPGYFQETFHYQTDGWLSKRSAEVYEMSTENLFLGRQDAMQRSTLVPLSDFMQGKDASQLKALEVGCGTGRFATFVKDNYPTLDLTLLDLSPFYLAEARSNMRYWKSKRADGISLGGVDGNGTAFILGAAESLPATDAVYDIVYSVYLLHELPPDVRRKAILEMARVLKPGGLLILTDSNQLGDRPVTDSRLGTFGDLNEPYYRSYIETDLSAIAEEAGLTCSTKVLASASKSLSFFKPTPALGGVAAMSAAPVAEATLPPDSAVDPLLN